MPQDILPSNTIQVQDNGWLEYVGQKDKWFTACNEHGKDAGILSPDALWDVTLI